MSEEKTHFAKTAAADQTYQVFFNQEPILESNQAIELNEHYGGKDFDTVIYFPESDISTLRRLKTDRTTHCPIKGDASYWNYRDAENGIWSYQEPLTQVSQIKKHFAFDQSKGFRVTVAG
jgi:uncharacterized protein (DUF427 family)